MIRSFKEGDFVTARQDQHNFAISTHKDMGGRGRARQLHNPRTWANRPEVIARRGMMVGLREAGHSVSEVARQMGISRATAQLWLHRFEREGHVKTRPSWTCNVIPLRQDDT
ncbi:hypothetical protein Pcinc_005499 [Petrolisthes cinctipes]|uniref:Uncharacterized protein n=1 Tax=Petrolisthes cinctipes TaxID=88211 RepID=A0AAE1GEQ6_PETCI|nr:hypothetical protein Pcinc_005499 [Petrolisthes cinctipes]